MMQALATVPFTSKKATFLLLTSLIMGTAFIDRVLAQSTDDNPAVRTVPQSPTVTPNAGQSTLESREQAYRRLATQIQTLLNTLGFYAGVPDGVPGRTTRSALEQFHAAIGAPVSNAISTTTLDTLNAELRKLAVAEQLVEQSEQALAQGNSPLAEQRLRAARNESALVKIPERLKQALNFTEEVPDSTGTAPPSNDTQEAAPVSSTGSVSTPPSASVDTSARLTALKQEIRDLQIRINRQQDIQEQHLERIRNSF